MVMSLLGLGQPEHSTLISALYFLSCQSRSTGGFSLRSAASWIGKYDHCFVLAEFHATKAYAT